MRKTGYGLLVLVFFLPLFVQAAWQSATHACPYLDRRRPLYDVSMGITPDARTKGTDNDYAELSIDLEADLFYIHNLLHGDLDLAMRLDSVFPLQNTADFLPPDHLMAFVLEGRWFWRYTNGTGLELTLEPGLYADTSDVLDMPMAMPITVAGVYSAHAGLAGVAGLSLRPGFNRLVMPVAGVVWEPQPNLRIEALLPEGSIKWSLDREWVAHAGWHWVSTTYAVDPELDGLDRFTTEYKTLYVGASYRLQDEFRVYGSLGWLLDRRIRKTQGRDDLAQTTDIDDGILLQIGIAGAL